MLDAAQSHFSLKNWTVPTAGELVVFLPLMVHTECCLLWCLRHCLTSSSPFLHEQKEPEMLPQPETTELFD